MPVILSILHLWWQLILFSSNNYDGPSMRSFVHIHTHTHTLASDPHFTGHSSNDGSFEGSRDGASGLCHDSGQRYFL